MATTTNGSMSFSAAIDNSQLKADVEEIKRILSGMAGRVEAEGSRMDNALSNVGKTIGGVFAVAKLKEFATQVANVRGEFQQLEVAFNTMLGSTEKADALMQQLIRTAATTPFDLQGVANGAKQLLAYGEDVEKVNDDLIRLGNIAAGLSQPLNDIVYLYGTTMTQGRLYTQDLNQFTGRGIPMIRELATVLGVAQDRVKEMVEAGKVGFPEVQQVIRNLTDEGGTFYNLMEEQSKTITGRIGNIEDAIETMFNDIGKQSEGIIGGVLDTVSSLVENYERVGRVLAGLVATYGTYKAAVMTVTAVQALQATGIGALTVAEAAHYGWLVLVEKAQKLLNATMLSNPYVLVATLIAGVVAAMVSMKNETERLKEAEEAYQAAKQETIATEEEHKRRLEELCGVAANESLATDTRREALNRLEQKYPDIFARYDTEYEKLKNIKQIKEEIAALEASQSVTLAQNELDSVERRIGELEAKKATERRVVVASASGARVRRTGGLTRDEEAELKNLRNKRKELSESVRKEQADAYFEDLTGVSNETLEEQIKQRENLLARMKTQEKKYGAITYGNTVLRGTYSRDELQYQLNRLEAEKNRRNAATGSSTEWAAQARKEYEEALKAYNDFLADTSNSLTQEDYEAKAKELKEALSAAKAEWDKYQPSGGSGDKAAQNAEREQKEREKAEQKAADSLLALQKQNQQAELDLMDGGTEKKLAQIDADYEKRKAEIEKKVRELAELNKEAGVSGTDAGGLTQEQQSAIDEANRLADENRKKQILEAYNEEAAAMRDYLEQYGTYQQQKLAIAQEYAEKIRKAGSEGERMSLEKERDSRLAGVEAQELKASIDWQTVFGNFGSMFEDMITPVLEKAKAYMQTDEFKNADQSSQQALVEAVQQMTQSIGNAGAASFGNLGRQVEAYQSALAKLTDAQDRYKEAFDDLTDAQESYREALVNGTAEEQAAAQSALATAQQNEQAAAENVESLQKAADAAQQAMTGTATTLKTSMEGVVSGLQQLSSGSLSGAYNGLIELGNSAEKIGGTLGKAFGKIADSLNDVPIVGWIASILDIFQDGISDLVATLLDTIYNAVSGIISDVLSGDLVVTAFDSVKSGVSNVLNAITFGGFGKLMDKINGSNAKEVQEAIDRLTERNEALEQAIEDLTDTIEGVGGTKSVEAYKEAVEYQKEYQENLLEIAKEQAGYHGSHHSWGYYWDKSGGFTDEEIAELSEKIGREWNGDLWDLSPEEMKQLRTMVDTWQRMYETGHSGYGESVVDKLDDYIDQAGVLDDLLDSLNETLTGISFDDLYDSFLDTLMDMDADAEDFADSLTEYFMQAMLSNQIADLYSDALQEWYDKYAEYMSDFTLSDEEMAELREEFSDIVNGALELRDALAEATGYDSLSDRSGTTGGITTASQDTVDELNARATTIQGHTYTINENTKLLVTNTNLILQSVLNIEGNTDGLSARMENVESYVKETMSTISDIALKGIKVRT